MKRRKKLLKNMNLTIVHLYPEEMNIYGDLGNIITLKKRCIWRNIDVIIKNVDKKQNHSKDYLPEGDLFFMGGGQDNDMMSVFEDLLKYKKEYIINNIKNKKVFLLICGAFQLFGKYFLDSNNNIIKGLNILQLETKAPGNSLEERCIGNLVSMLTKPIQDKIRQYYKGDFDNTLVGFENHIGQTYFTNQLLKPLAKVIKGKGNNSKELIEGAVLNNIFASYSHGSLLPKNPHIADLLISLALETKYNTKIKLNKLDDYIEWQAHRFFKQEVIS